MNLLRERLCKIIHDAASFDEACQLTVEILAKNVPHFNWVGIYLAKDKELVLTAWNGPEAAEHTRIPIGQGICGLAARRGETVIVDDVNADSRYLACFPHTRAEIVVPIFKDDRVIGEIDIDSDKQAAFTGEDRMLLEEAATLLAGRWG
ncbi:GAF domain-containing protein [Candidatus Bipolaricaulota bacterium]|nr:GAF domain-containing protein [Candidatus Bipolaricaulota bacterium]